MLASYVSKMQSKAFCAVKVNFYFEVFRVSKVGIVLMAWVDNL